MQVLQKYRLELHWQSVERNKEDVAVLKGAYFCGPVLEDAEKLREEDELTLDMTMQHKVFIPDYYQAVLRWKGVSYGRGKIFLKEAWIRGKYVNSIEVLENTDWLLIDCMEHEEKRHPFNLVYWAEVCKQGGESKY